MSSQPTADDLPPLWFPEGFDWKDQDYAPVFKHRAEMLQRLRRPAVEATDTTPAILAGSEFIPALKDFYRQNPVYFIHDICMTSDPRNLEVGKAAEMPFLLFPKQVEFINWLHARWKGRQDGLAEKSRDVGLSWLCVAFATWMWLFYPGSVIGFGSRKEELVDKLGDPKSLFWKARQLIELLPQEFKPAGWNAHKHAPNMRILNPENGSAIIGEAGNNIGRGARAGIYFKDESSHYEQPEAIDAALSATANCKIDVSTPNGAGNPFYQKRHGGKIPVFTFSWRDDPRKDQAWYDKQCQTLDPVIVAAEIDLNYEGSVTNVFIPAPLVVEAMRKGPADIQPIGGLRVGIDVARFGDDKSAIVFRRGRVVLKVIEMAKLDIPDVAGRARREIDAYKERPEQIAVDTVGLGSGVADLLRAWYPDREDRRTGRIVKTVVDVNSQCRMSDDTNYNLRAFMWSEMKEWLKTASLPNEAELRVELTALRYKFKGGELLLESKEDAKRRGIKSPNKADALAMTFAHPTISADKVKGRRLPRHQSTVPSCGVLG